MPYFRSCVGCAENRDSCPIRASLTQAVKGLGIRSLRHHCVKWTPQYEPGQPVKVLTVDSMEGNRDEPDDGIVNDWFPATVVRQDGGKVVAYVVARAQGEHSGAEFYPSQNGFVRVPLARVKASDHEAVSLAQIEAASP